MRRLIQALLIGIIIGLCSGCTAPGPSFTTTQEGYRVDITFAQTPMINQSVAATIRFFYDDQPLATQNVVCDLQMPGMVMGSMRPIADPQADGSHFVNLLFTMDGDWGIIITADSEKGPIRLFVEGIIIEPDPNTTPSPIP